MSCKKSEKRPASEMDEDDTHTKVWIVNLINDEGDCKLIPMNKFDQSESSEIQESSSVLADDSLYEHEEFLKMPCPSGTNPKKRSNSGWNKNRHKLKFYELWLTEFPFLKYDEEKNVMYCKACRKFVNDWRKNSPFVIGTDNFRVTMIRYHEKSTMHKECQELVDALVSQDCDAMEKDLYRDQLSHVFKSVYFLYKNKMPLTSFPQLCESQKKEGTDFTVYTTHIKACKMFGKFIGISYEKELAAKIANIREFSLIIDASFQRNIECHDMVYLKYIDGLIIQTIFLGVIDSSAKLHHSMYITINNLFRRYQIDNWADKVVYIMTDKSDNHLWLEGLINIVDESSPANFISDVKYLPHKIKYCSYIVQSHQSTNVIDSLVWSIYCHYEKLDQTKRNLLHMNKELANIINFFGNLPKNSYTTLYYEALKAIEEDWTHLVSLIFEQQELNVNDVKSRKSGTRILQALIRNSFIYKMSVLLDIFSFLSKFSTILGEKSLLPFDVHILLEETCLNIEAAANGEGPMVEQISEELSDNPGYFRGKEIKNDCSLQHILPEMKKIGQVLISYLKSLIDNTLLEKSFIFNVSLWPEDDDTLALFGNSEFVDIFLCFKGKTDQEKLVVDEWCLFKTKVKTWFPVEVRQDSKSVIAKMVAECESEFPLVIPVLRKILLLNFESAEIIRGYHEMCLNKSHNRCMLSLQSLQSMMMINMHGPAFGDFDFSSALDLFLNSKDRKFRKKIMDRKRTVDFSDGDTD